MRGGGSASPPLGGAAAPPAAPVLPVPVLPVLVLLVPVPMPVPMPVLMPVVPVLVVPVVPVPVPGGCCWGAAALPGPRCSAPRSIPRRARPRTAAGARRYLAGFPAG